MCARTAISSSKMSHRGLVPVCVKSELNASLCLLHLFLTTERFPFCANDPRESRLHINTIAMAYKN